MKPWLAVIVVAAALVRGVEASDPVVVVQETRAPAAGKKHSGVQHVVLLKNVSAYPVRGLRVTVEFYDFFGKLLWSRTAVPVPASLGPGDTATLTLPVPRLESASQTRYRFQYGGGPPHRGRQRPRRGRRDPVGSGRPIPLPEPRI